MRSRTVRMLRFVTGEVGLVLLLLTLAVVVTSMPAHAQEGIWQVDKEHSVARLSLGTAPKSAEVGVARVSGKVVFPVSDATDPIVDLDIIPDKAGADYSEMSFKSKRSMMTSDGKLMVVGDLSLTRVERSVIAYSGGGEGYYGPQYGEPVAHIDTREVTLAFPNAVLPVAHNGVVRLVVATNINRERFPQLLTSLAAGNWPNIVVEDESCTMPTTIGEDYSGPTCTGTQVATATNSVTTYAGGGEGYFGSEPAIIPAGSQATIAFDLKLTQLASAPSATSGGAETAGN